MAKEIELKDYLTLSRKFFTHEFWKEKREFSKAEAWLDLIREARYFDDTQKQFINNQHVEWGRGQLVASYRFLSERWGWSTKKVGNFLNFLEENNMARLGREKETAVTVITLCKYDCYNTTSKKGKQQGNSGETAGKQQGNKTNIGYIGNIGEVEAPPLFPLSEVETKKSQVEIDYENLNIWLSTYAPKVLKMQEPITLTEFSRLQKEFCGTPEGKQLFLQKLKAMHNRKDLLQRYTSANLTLREWIKMGLERQTPVIQLPIKPGRSARELQDEKLLNEIHGTSQKPAREA